MALARELVAPYRGIPPTESAISRTMKSAGGPARCLFSIRSKPATSATKQRWVETASPALFRRLDTVYRRFPASRAASIRGTHCSPRTAMTRMRPGGGGIHAVREWYGIVARPLLRAGRAGDPSRRSQALYFGDRLPIYYDPAAVRAMAPHVDAIATNYNVDAAMAGSPIISSTVCENCRAASRCWSPNGFSRPGKTAPATATTAI